MLINNIQTRYETAWGPGSVRIVEINQPPLDTFAVVSLAKTRGGGAGSGAGGFCGIVSVDGDDLSEDFYPPSFFRTGMKTISFGILSEGQYAQGMITLFQEV